MLFIGSRVEISKYEVTCMNLFVFSSSCRLVSSIHAVMATAAGIIVVSSCKGNVIMDR